MKRITGLIIITALIMSIAACGQAPAQAPATPVTTQASATPTLTQAAATPTRTVTAAPTKAASPAPTETATPAPTETATPAPSPTPAPEPTKTAPAAAAPSSDVVIIAKSYGEICGGYANGEWLSESEAAAYCEGKMTFGRYDLTEFIETVESSGVTYDEGEYTDEILTVPGAYGRYYLDIPDYDDSLYYTYLYSGGKLPDIEIVEDTSELSLPAQLAEGEAEVSIGNAVIADIDGDGEKETVVDARLSGEDFFGISFWCIIESDGTVKTISDDYSNSMYYYGDIYLQNIIDIDGDNISELVIDYGWGADDSGMWVFKYDGNNLTEVLDYHVEGYCP